MERIKGIRKVLSTFDDIKSIIDVRVTGETERNAMLSEVSEKALGTIYEIIELSQLSNISYEDRKRAIERCELYLNRLDRELPDDILEMSKYLFDKDLMVISRDILKGEK